MEPIFIKEATKTRITAQVNQIKQLIENLQYQIDLQIAAIAEDHSVDLNEYRAQLTEDFSQIVFTPLEKSEESDEAVVVPMTHAPVEG